MSRQKADPIARAFDAFVALNFDQRLEYLLMLHGYRRATDKEAPKSTERKAREKKTEAPLVERAAS